MGVIPAPFIHRNETYEVVISDHPEGKWFKVYGVQNRQTGVIEAFVSQLAAAITVADSLRDDLREGLRPKEADKAADAALTRILEATKAMGRGN